MNNICIIPARGGSKRIPNKNIKLFLGKPIIAYSIETALRSNLFSEVIVSTDSDQISTIAKSYGASVPFKRSITNSNDNATTLDVMVEVHNELRKRSYSYKYICCIYPAAPLIDIKDLIKGRELIGAEDIDAVIPVKLFSHPIQRAFHSDEDSSLTVSWPRHFNKRTQDLKQYCHDIGQWYWYTCEAIEKKELRKRKGVYIEESRSQDIDNHEDWKVAEIKYLATRYLLDFHEESSTYRFQRK